MMKGIFFMLVMFGFVPLLLGQTPLALFDCYDMAIANYGIEKDKALYGSIREVKDKKIKAGHYPQLSLNAKATYQSDVTALDLSSLPFEVNIESPSKDQYKATLDVNQVIYDGGIKRTQEELNAIEQQLNGYQLEVDQYDLKERVTENYFNLLQLEQNILLLNLTGEQLRDQLKVVESGVAHGVLLKSDLEMLKAEIIKLEQQLVELGSKRMMALEALGEIIGKNVSDGYVLEFPGENVIAGMLNPAEAVRPEIKLLEEQKTKLSTSEKMLGATKMPKLYGFGQLGYGRPGLNMLSNEFAEFYIVGATFSWNIWDWRQNNYERQALYLQKQLLDNRQATVSRSLRISEISLEKELEKYKELIRQDEEIISLRESITKSYASQLKNGTITSSEYIAVLNKEKQSRIDLSIHKLKMGEANIELLMIRGKL